MGHDKLRKFAENETFSCLLQPDASAVLDKSGDPSDGLRLHDHAVKGRWNELMFRKEQPIVLELGCGKGEYTIDLSRRLPDCNYIGVDIKGARLWKGAKTATQENLPNVAFLRTRIEFIEAFFGAGEVSEIWLTFSDPQLKSENSRLTSPLFLERYRRFLKPGGIIHLKTDSRFLHEYTMAVVRENGLSVLASTTDLYAGTAGVTGEGSVEADVLGGRVLPATVATLGHVRGGTAGEAGGGVCEADVVRQDPATKDDLLKNKALYEVQTFYERMFLSQGYKITYMAFTIDHDGPYKHPSAFDSDYWRSIEGPRRFTHSPESSHR
ncbi:MAG: tRNA (guanosine(46)-N7)-methyltransferase TrmB [Bacteroidales bacterium]|nr:tRNA (guanosine(46)-N7)-methyltransferase TrmB [Bacteroidales bacterium]